MTLRAIAARWFEIVVAREWLPALLQTLAGTGRVELDQVETGRARTDVAGLLDRLARWRTACGTLAAHLPEPAFRRFRPDEDLGRVIDDALRRLGAWQAAVAPVVEELARIRRDAAELALVEGYLRAARAPGIRFDPVPTDDRPIAVALFCQPVDRDPPELPSRTDAVLEVVESPPMRFFLVLERRSRLARWHERLAAAGGRPLALPPWLHGGPGEALAQVRDHRNVLEHQELALTRRIEELTARFDAATARGDVERLEWLGQHLTGIPISGHLAVVTGWTALEPRELRDDLARGEIPGVVHFPDPPASKRIPSLFGNPAWARPFELFSRLLGTPGIGEPEPSVIVAFLAPLLFGYMFADVGQGLVLAALGFALHRRVPMLSMLVPAGLSATLFGLAFGSVFGVESLLPALWFHPLAAPLQVLAIPLAGGVVILALGILLAVLGLSWAGLEHLAWRREVPLLVLFLGLVAGAFDARGLVLAAVGCVWYLLGAAVLGTGAWPGRVAGAAGELVEQVVQLLINTISFVRVGAFALAHAGLGLTFYSLAGTVQHRWASLLILVLGNVLVIALEGLVVTIQTTRLILFEFFVRFLRGEGRPFRPTLLPLHR